MIIPVALREIVAALEREAANTDTDARWLAAAKLREIPGWEGINLNLQSVGRRA